MKPFNLEEAKAGKPVCTRDGHEVEILKWDAMGEQPLVGIIKFPIRDTATNWTEEGKLDASIESDYDLFMKSNHHEGWINIVSDYYSSTEVSVRGVYKTKEDAKLDSDKEDYITTVKVEWED